jgi:hypothetical protein
MIMAGPRYGPVVGGVIIAWCIAGITLRRQLPSGKAWDELTRR